MPAALVLKQFSKGGYFTTGLGAGLVSRRHRLCIRGPDDADMAEDNKNMDMDNDTASLVKRKPLTGRVRRVSQKGAEVSNDALR